MFANKTPSKETKLTLVAVACVVVGSAALLIGVEFAFGEASMGSGAVRSEWLDARVTPPSFSGADSEGTHRVPKHSTVVDAPKGDFSVASQKEKHTTFRLEDLGFQVHETSSVFDEIPVRRNLDELESFQVAARARAERIAQACEDRCEEGLAELDVRSAFGRETLAERRAGLVARGENEARVTRDLEFVE
jgi:hypothetical protein